LPLPLRIRLISIMMTWINRKVHNGCGNYNNMLLFS
jgi:hypothetical protein